MSSENFGAIVLAGGRAARLGGVEKATVRLGDRSLLDYALDAVEGAAELVVVGPTVPTGRPVRFVREEPAYGGPVAGLLAGRDALHREVEQLVVLAVDMPCLTSQTVRRLIDAAAGRDGAVLVDAEGRRHLAFVVGLARLDAVRPDRGAEPGVAVRDLLRPLDLAAVPARGAEHLDVDTADDVHELSAQVGRTADS